MNCKQGDLAILIAAQMTPSSIGSIVKILKRGPDWQGVPTWITTPDSGGRNWSRDSSLRPIRDNPGEDESFRWAPSPTQKELA